MGDSLQALREDRRNEYLEAIARKGEFGDDRIAVTGLISCVTNLFSIAESKGLEEHPLYKQALKICGVLERQKTKGKLRDTSEVYFHLARANYLVSKLLADEEFRDPF